MFLTQREASLSGWNLKCYFSIIEMTEDSKYVAISPSYHMNLSYIFMELHSSIKLSPSVGYLSISLVMMLCGVHCDIHTDSFQEWSSANSNQLCYDLIKLMQSCTSICETQTTNAFQRCPPH